MPRSSCSARWAMTSVSAMRAGVRARRSFAKATWFVASATLSCSPASIITERRTPQRASSHSVCPTKPGSARATCAFDTGAVQSAAASPRRTAAKAASRKASWAAPAAGTGRPGRTAPAGRRVTATSAPPAGKGSPGPTVGRPRPPRSRARTRASPKTRGWSSLAEREERLARHLRPDAGGIAEAHRDAGERAARSPARPGRGGATRGAHPLSSGSFTSTCASFFSCSRYWARVAPTCSS